MSRYDKYPLHSAATARDLNAAQAALRNGSKVNQANDAGLTPLMCAALVNCRPMTEELLANGADVSLEDSRRWTALHLCAKHGGPEVAKVLIAHGADILAKNADGKSPYDLAPESAWALRSLLRPPVVSALRSDTVGATLERRRLAEQLGLPDLPLVPAEASGETTMAQKARQQREMEAEEARAAGAAAAAAADGATPVTPTMFTPPPMMTIPTRLDVAKIHFNLLPAQAGNERVLLMESMSDNARWLSLHPLHFLKNLMSASVDCKVCCWQHAQPRSYVRVTENAVEYNIPNIMAPCELCIVDDISKVYLDKMGHHTPFRVRCCSPYHFCVACEPCGQVVAFAPHPACANGLCSVLFYPLFHFVPGLVDADAFVDYYRMAQQDFVERKKHDTGDPCGCFHKKAK